ncbi:hypothetical protein BC826DRAFT_1186602 [Russula brevipes]|nr:hypothetical protein BC826DRAFT_1186602 [Russula brevipes]
MSSFGFILGRAPRAPEERERLCKERLAFFRRCRAYQQRKYLPKFKLHRAPTNSYDAQYTREYVGQKAHLYRFLPSPALLAPPATDCGGQVLDPDMFVVVPEIREHAPPKWDEWCPTRRPEGDVAIDVSMLFAPAVSSTGGLYPLDFARYFPSLWRKALAEHNCEARRANKERSSKWTLTKVDRQPPSIPAE